MSNGWPTSTWAIPPTVPAVKSLTVLLPFFDILFLFRLFPLSGLYILCETAEAAAKVFGGSHPCSSEDEDSAEMQGQEQTRDKQTTQRQQQGRSFAVIVGFIHSRSPRETDTVWRLDSIMLIQSYRARYSSKRNRGTTRAACTGYTVPNTYPTKRIE